MSFFRTSRFLAKIASAILVAGTVSACSDSSGPETGSSGRIRIFNNVFQGASAAAAVPIAVDFLIDSSTAAPAVTGLPNGTFAPGNASDAGAGSGLGNAALFTAAGYRDIAVGLHTFQARKAAQTGAQSAFFRNSNGTEFLPRQYITAFPYTCVLAGVIPPDGTNWSTSPIGFCIVATADDPFTPPRDTLPGHSGLTARLRFINAATFATTTGTGTSLTFTLVPSTSTVSPVNLAATAAFRAASPFVNPPAGAYTLNITSSAGLIHSAPITFAAGEVRTVLVYSTGFSSNPVTTKNSAIANTLDNKF
jgi:hypothetical protein